jgi:S-adenosylmethionine-diacylglycerol 3-amino-3-carboxypropyl transferase
MDGAATPPPTIAAAPVAASRANVAKAVQRGGGRDALLERLFTALFSGLVYPQIWEDPAVDAEALALGPGKRVMAIASGGCNVMSYLVWDPARIVAVDLNAHHVALVRLKLAAAATLPDYRTFYRLFGEGSDPANRATYDRVLRGALDAETRAYWDGRDMLMRRRIGLFARGLYRQGLLGRFIGAGHLLARLLGVRLAPVTECATPEEQRAWYDATIAPLFRTRIVRRIAERKASLFGLGIPPAQYDALAGDAGGDIVAALDMRLRRLVCDFPMSENYFAWQAFARRYAGGDAGPLPPYLQGANWAAIKARAGRVTVENRSFTERLAEAPAESFDGYVLLDAQDWMTDAQLNALWSEITRKAAPGARVIFRTAAAPSLLPGRVEPAILDRWDYRAADSARLHARDRSAIYGGFHIYELRP